MCVQFYSFILAYCTKLQSCDCQPFLINASLVWHVTDTRPRRLRSAAHASTVSRTRTNFGDRAFSAAGPRVCSYLPTNLRQPDLSYSRFRQSLKTFSFGQLNRSAVWILHCERSIKLRFRNPCLLTYLCWSVDVEWWRCCVWWTVESTRPRYPRAVPLAPAATCTISGPHDNRTRQQSVTSYSTPHYTLALSIQAAPKKPDATPT